MATINTVAQKTLVDAAREEHGGAILPVAEVLNQSNEILQDAPFFEANAQETHLITRRKSLPVGTWRSINAGVANETSQKQGAREPIGVLETYSEVDARIIDNSANPIQSRLDEDLAFVEGLGQTAATALFYGDNTVDPNQPTGLAARVNATTNAQFVEGTGTGSDLASIWIVTWGKGSAYLTFPRNSAAGLRIEDKGRTTLQDASGLNYEGYRTHFAWDLGMVVEDDKAIVRYGNIEADGFDDTLLITALGLVRKRGNPNTRIYVNNTQFTQMEIDAASKNNIFYTSREVGGVPFIFFRGVPIRMVDALTQAETEVT